MLQEIRRFRAGREGGRPARAVPGLNATRHRLGPRAMLSGRRCTGRCAPSSCPRRRKRLSCASPWLARPWAPPSQLWSPKSTAAVAPTTCTTSATGRPGPGPGYASSGGLRAGPCPAPPGGQCALRSRRSPEHAVFWPACRAGRAWEEGSGVGWGLYNGWRAPAGPAEIGVRTTFTRAVASAARFCRRPLTTGQNPSHGQTFFGLTWWWPRTPESIFVHGPIFRPRQKR